MDEVTKALIERLDAGANHQGYPEEFGQSWTKLCADAANTVRVLSARLAAQSAAPVGWGDDYPKDQS